MTTPTSMGNHGGTVMSYSPYAHPGFAEICILHRTWSTVALGTYELAYLIKKKKSTRRAEVKRKADGSEAAENEPTIAAWKRWVQGPFPAFQTIMTNAKLREQAAEWTIGLMEDMAEDKVPEGAVPALVLRVGIDIDKEQAITALAVYRERRGLRVDFCPRYVRPLRRRQRVKTTTPSSGPSSRDARTKLGLQRSGGETGGSKDGERGAPPKPRTAPGTGKRGQADDGTSGVRMDGPQMVGHSQLWVSQKGVAFDMQGPPPSACRWCGGNHWEQFCPAAQQQQAHMGQGQQGMAPGQGFMGNQQTVNMAVGQQTWGRHMVNAGHQSMADPMQAQAAQGVGG